MTYQPAGVNERAKAELERTFIARMISEYKAQLVKYVDRCQVYINGYQPDEGDTVQPYWRAELIEATRRLELSDAELMPFIAPEPPHQITR